MQARAPRVFRLVTLMIGLLVVASPAQAQLGAAAGYGLNMPNDPSFSSPAQNTFESTGGVSVGLFYNFSFGRLALRPGLFLRQSSFDWQLDEVDFSPLQSKIRMAEVPIDVRFRFPREQFSPFVVAGPGFNFAHTDQPDLRQVMNSPEGTTYFTSLNAGAGIEIPIASLGLRLLPEVRYSYALSGFLKENYIVRTVPFEADSAQRMDHLTFRLGISFLSIR